MPTALCGWLDTPAGAGRDFLVQYGPTLLVDIGFDPAFKAGVLVTPKAAALQQQALVDSGASESCIDSTLAQRLQLPIVDRRPVSGVHGSQDVNMHLAQIHVPALNFTIYGVFAGVDLVAGGQPHMALIGRTFLQHFKMEYDGRTGNVSISS